VSAAPPGLLYRKDLERPLRLCSSCCRVSPLGIRMSCDDRAVLLMSAGVQDIICGPMQQGGRL
jgi:hypothetical protein